MKKFAAALRSARDQWLIIAVVGIFVYAVIWPGALSNTYKHIDDRRYALFPAVEPAAVHYLRPAVYSIGVFLPVIVTAWFYDLRKPALWLTWAVLTPFFGSYIGVVFLVIFAVLATGSFTYAFAFQILIMGMISYIFARLWDLSLLLCVLSLANYAIHKLYA